MLLRTLGDPECVTAKRTYPREETSKHDDFLETPGLGPAKAESGEMSARGTKMRTESVSLMEHASEMATSVSAGEKRHGMERRA